MQGQQETIASQITDIEKRHKIAQQKLNDARQSLKESQERFLVLKQKIVEQGEKAKEASIEQARQESRLMIEGAKDKIDGQIIQAQRKIRSEIVDSAIALSLQKLPAKITSEDNQKLVDAYLDTVFRC